MMIYNDTFLKIKKILSNPIIEYIEKFHEVNSKEIHKYIAELKEKHPETFELIDFSYSYPYSEQIAEVLTDLVRDFILEETDEGYTLINRAACK